jgi:hypothetical protein
MMKYPTKPVKVEFKSQAKIIAERRALRKEVIEVLERRASEMKLKLDELQQILK